MTAVEESFDFRYFDSGHVEVYVTLYITLYFAVLLFHSVSVLSILDHSWLLCGTPAHPDLSRSIAIDMLV